jgi:hypothetical protein
MSDLNEDAHVERFEKLKGETLDLLGGNQQWMLFEEIALEHEACDGEVDRDELLVALEELIAEGLIEHREDNDGEDEYRWHEPNAGESMDAKVRRLETENARLEDEAVGMRRQLVEQAERIEQLERELAERRESLL